MIEKLLHVLRVIGVIVLFMAAAIVFVNETRAHEFYEPWCCNGKDCVPYHGVVERTPNGWYLPEFKTTIPYKNAQGTRGYAKEAGTRYMVPDDDNYEFHICVMPWEPTEVRCFYARPGGV